MNSTIITASRRGVTTLATVIALLLVAATVAFATGGDRVCPDPSGLKVEVTGEHSSLTITAPQGQLIASFCVKAGSEQQGNGTHVVVLDPPLASVTIVHPSGKAISHYVPAFVPVTPPTTGGPPSTTTTTSTGTVTSTAPPTTTSSTTATTSTTQPPSTTTSSSSPTATDTVTSSSTTAAPTTTSSPPKMTSTGKVVKPTKLSTTSASSTSSTVPSTVTVGQPEVLAYTGSRTERLLWGGLAFLVIGGGFLLVARRIGRGEHQ